MLLLCRRSCFVAAVVVDVVVATVAVAPCFFAVVASVFLNY